MRRRVFLLEDGSFRSPPGACASQVKSVRVEPFSSWIGGALSWSFGLLVGS